jgi:hypothetical protein
MTTYKLPRRFYDDHVYRDFWGGEIVSSTKQSVTVELDREAYDELLSDASFYASMGEGEFERHLSGVVKSAAATVKALTKAGAPDV